MGNLLCHISLSFTLPSLVTLRDSILFHHPFVTHSRNVTHLVKPCDAAFEWLRCGKLAFDLLCELCVLSESLTLSLSKDKTSGRETAFLIRNLE